MLYYGVHWKEQSISWRHRTDWKVQNLVVMFMWEGGGGGGGYDDEENNNKNDDIIK